jgi:multimeric flavodoxin WrbA
MKNGTLKAIFINCSIKPSSDVSNTKALMDMLSHRMGELDSEMEIEHIHALDYNIKHGTKNDEGAGDEWPKILEKMVESDIIVFGSPVWMGLRSSVLQQIMERLDGTMHADPNPENGQFALYNKVAGIVVTGNEDGAHDVIASTFANLAHFGLTIPPHTDVYWVGDAGPGMSFIDEGGAMSPYVNRNIELASHNLIHGAKMVRDNPYTVDMNIIGAQMMKKMEIKKELMMEMMPKMKEKMGGM